MNRYNLNHRPGTESTQELAICSSAIESVGKLFYKISQGWDLSAPNKSKSYTLLRDPEYFFICVINEKEVGIGFRVTKKASGGQPPFTLRLPLETVVTKTVEEMADMIGLQLYEAQTNYDAAFKPKSAVAGVQSRANELAKAGDVWS